jgi:DNA-binding HxlR family transcriptional regulator
MSSESTAVSRDVSGVIAEEPLFAEPDEVFDSVQDVLGRKWHLRIVYHLLETGPMGFSALKTEIVGISSKMLSESLTALEDAGLVERSVVSDQPLRVEYSLTAEGKALEPVVSSVVRWGAEHGPGRGAE